MAAWAHLKKEMHLKALATTVKAKIGAKSHKGCRQPGFKGPAGGNLLRQRFQGWLLRFLSSSAQVMISGDLKYHDARDAEARGGGID